jgi:DNA-binding NarL/FixJ family response regulator
MNGLGIVLVGYRLLREGLRALLASEADLSIVGETSDGLRVVELVTRTRPQVLVIDLMVPGLNGLDVARQVKKRAPDTAVLVLSSHTSEWYVLEALRSGAMGYLPKEAEPAELVRAIRELSAGRRYLGVPLSSRVLETQPGKPDPGTHDTYETLTAREREVLQLAAEGHPNAEVGRRLFISPRTVEIHRANAMRKLCLVSQTDLVRYALRRGLISLND